MNGTTHGPGIDVAAHSRNGADGTGEWPRRSFLELGALPGAVPCARLHSRQVMWEWGLDALRDDTELVVSELVTNAVRACASLRPAAPVRMWLRGNTTRVLVLVWDACPRPPVRRHAEQNTDGGRGLLLVEALSDQWDWYAIDQPEGGKIVWATLGPPTPAPAAH
jgi:anti-sigma regulatory factor (Ser/Thr protein kinase)